MFFNLFQIHQRHGAKGQFLYLFTLILCAVAAIDCGIFLYGAIFPKKQQ